MLHLRSPLFAVCHLTKYSSRPAYSCSHSFFSKQFSSTPGFPPMRNNNALALLRKKKVAVGTWLTLGSHHSARLLAAQGAFDWLILDLEHTPLDAAQVSIIMSTIADVSQGRVTPIVRVTAGTVHHIKQALDGGAQGVIVPLVNTVEDARNAVRHTRYPPQGERGVGGLIPHLSYGTSRAEYVAQANQEILLGIIIETKQAIDNVDEILAVEGIDLVLLGGADLQMSMGLPPMLWGEDAAFKEAVRKLRAACVQRGLPLGILCPDAGAVKQRLEDGFQWIGVSSDAHLLLAYAGIQAAIARGEAPSTSAGDSLKGLGI